MATLGKFVGRSSRGTRGSPRWRQSLLTALPLILAVMPAHAADIFVDATCTLRDAILAANTDRASGGCPAGADADTIVLPPNSVFTLSAAEPQGGAGLPQITSPVTIEGNGSRIERDSAAPTDFAVLSTYGSELTLNDTTISGGTQSGIINAINTLTLNRCTVADNRTEGNGGGIVNFYGQVTLSASVVTGNAAKFLGGGIMSVLGDVSIERSTIEGNSAGDRGGGLYAFANVGIVDSTISGNQATVGGGISQSEGNLFIGQSTISGNIAESAGGVYSAGHRLILSRSVISGNDAGFPREVSGQIVTADDFNLLGYETDAGIDGFTPGTTDIVPSVALSSILDPVLGEHGGPTPTHLLVPGSPAIDAGPVDGDCSSRDQRGVTRPQGGGCDLGAVERIPDPCPSVTASFGCTVNGISGRLCLGTSQNDVIVGTSGNDVIVALAGHDRVWGQGGNDLICGGAGNDTLLGASGADALFGGPGRDILDGGRQADSLDGGSGPTQCSSDGADVNLVGCE